MEKEVKLYIKLTLDGGFATSLRGHRTGRGQHAVKARRKQNIRALQREARDGVDDGRAYDVGNST